MARVRFLIRVIGSRKWKLAGDPTKDIRDRIIIISDNKLNRRWSE